MLAELLIRNFAIIDELRIQFLAGLNVLTGETGAGKSIILDAMALVLGERADASMIRTGSEFAYVEGAFIFRVGERNEVSVILEEEGLDAGDGDLILARELRTNGRNICRINGRTASLNVLRQLGEMLVDIHGQGEHLSLMKPRAHLPLLDAYGSLEQKRKLLASEVEKLLAVRVELHDLERNERELEQRRDLLSFQVNEIDAAKLDLVEEEDLRSERTRLANAETLIENTTGVLRLLDETHDESMSVSDLLGHARQSLTRLAYLDPSTKDIFDHVEALTFQLADLVSELITYHENLEFNPTRLSDVEERLELISRLKRKYGDSIAQIADWRNKAAKELETIENSGERIQDLLVLEDKYLHNIGNMAAELSNLRKAAARKLKAAIESELVDLSMERAKFDVDFTWSSDPNGVYVDEQRLEFDRSGIDQVEFLVSANPGEALKPLARVASGGETSRLMLALKSVLAQVDETPTLIFDEIDQGIGGRVGDVVGRKLWNLTLPDQHQVIVVTHLPQLAGYADRHYHVSKATIAGRTVTRVNDLDQNGRVSELASMLGTQGQIATGGAESILEHIARTKTGALTG